MCKYIVCCVLSFQLRTLYATLFLRGTPYMQISRKGTQLKKVWEPLFYRVDAFSRCFSLQLRLACREFAGKLLICFLQLFVSSNRSLHSLLFQDHKMLHVEEPKRTQHSQIETKLSYLAIGKAQLNACAFSDGVEKQKCCLGPGDIKTVITFLLHNFLTTWPPAHSIFVAAVWCWNAGMVFGLALD